MILLCAVRQFSDMTVFVVLEFSYRHCIECRDKRETQVLAIVVRKAQLHEGLLGKDRVPRLWLLKYLPLNASRGFVFKDPVSAV